MDTNLRAYLTEFGIEFNSIRASVRMICFNLVLCCLVTLFALLDLALSSLCTLYERFISLIATIEVHGDFPLGIPVRIAIDSDPPAIPAVVLSLEQVIADALDSSLSYSPDAALSIIQRRLLPTGDEYGCNLVTHGQNWAPRSYHCRRSGLFMRRIEYTKADLNTWVIYYGKPDLLSADFHFMPV